MLQFALQCVLQYGRISFTADDGSLLIAVCVVMCVSVCIALCVVVWTAFFELATLGVLHIWSTLQHTATHCNTLQRTDSDGGNSGRVT